MAEPAFMTHDWLDGAGLRGWLEGFGVTRKDLDRIRGDHGDLGKEWARWGDGHLVSVWVADRALTGLGFHLSDVPERYWTVWATAMPEEQVAEAQRLRNEGMEAAEIADELGCTREQVWANTVMPVLDGPAVARFLLGKLRPGTPLGRTRESRIYRWYGGASPKPAIVAHELGRLGLVLGDLPAKCWRRR